jgi:uncharacterized damage-inducible protein DinB
MYPALESRSDILKLLDDLTQSRRDILQQCSQLSAGQLTDPVYAGTWSMLQNLAHLAWAEEFMLAWIRKRPNPLPKEEWPTEPALDLEEITIALDEAHASAIAFVKANTEAVLRESCRYTPPHDEETVGGVLFHLIEHEIGHRRFILHKLRKLTSQEPTRR